LKLSNSKLDAKDLLNPANANFRGQEKVNAEIFTALEILGRKLERTEAERDRLADRLEMLESAATLDEATGKIYLPAVIDDKSKKSLARVKVTNSFLTFSSAMSTVFAMAAFFVVAVANPEIVNLDKVVSLYKTYAVGSLRADEKTALVDDSENKEIAEAEASNTSEQGEIVADSSEFMKDEPVDEIVESASINADNSAATDELKVAEAVPAEEPKAEEVSSNVSETIENTPEEVIEEAPPAIDDKLGTIKPAEVAKVETKPEPAKAEASDYVTYDMPADGDLTGELKQLEQSAYSGIPEAQHDLGVFYAEGQLVKKDYKRAVYWLNKAAMNGVSNAAYNLAVMYQQGLGVKKNFEEAMHYYNYAVELGHPEAMYNLGIIYFVGSDGAKRDVAKGVSYFARAARLGVAEAAYNLGVLYESDTLGAIDLEKSKKYYKQAADSGYEKAKTALIRLEGGTSSVKEAFSKVDKSNKPAKLLNQ